MDYNRGSWSDEYYLKKMGIAPTDRVAIERVCQEYMVGLTWIMKYYCQGCVSWDCTTPSTTRRCCATSPP